MFYHKHHHRFHCSYLKGWEKRSKSQRFIHQAEESHWCPDHISLSTACPSHITRRRGHPQGRLLRKPTENMQTYRNKIHIHTLQAFTAAKSKRTELLGATEYIILAYSSYIIFWSQYMQKKKKKVTRECTCKSFHHNAMLVWVVAKQLLGHSVASHW